MNVKQQLPFHSTGEITPKQVQMCTWRNATQEEEKE